ncbi:hypothetical protein DMENIID0001_082400 [Sergentomyia squamirostris]
MISQCCVQSRPIYTKGMNLGMNNKKKPEGRQIEQLLPGVIGTAVGSAITPGIGGIIGGVVGPLVGSMVSSVVDNLMENLKEEQALNTLSDSPQNSYESYVVNIPNLGPYILLVPKVPSSTVETSSENKDQASNSDKTAIPALVSGKRAPGGVRMIPYKPIHLLKKPSGSAQVKLFHAAQNK